jgi:hypothetical protein
VVRLAGEGCKRVVGDGVPDELHLGGIFLVRLGVFVGKESR